MAQKKKGSAKQRAKVKRLQQKKTVRYRMALSILGFLGLSTLLGFAFLLGGGVPKGETAPIRKQASAPQVKKLAQAVRRSPKAVLVAEEYPQEEKKIGFGLEDLIRKTRMNAKATQSTEKGTALQKRGKPQLVLIIDDVSQARQLREIRSLPYHLTPSIFPPSQMNEHSNLLAAKLRHYLIHLPLQSGSAAMNRFEKTLFVDDGPARIRARVREIRRLFPHARFVNNHTGSVFTSNYKAMSYLYGDLKQEGFVFLDSRTTGHSVVRKIAAHYHRPYVARDVFLDNVQRRGAILVQLKRAVRIAKRRGYAIAIGHPHKATLEALRHAGKILSPVQIVYFDDFYRNRFGQ